jgi:hypothetical protein
MGKLIELNSSQKKYKWSWVPMAHACNPSYSGSRDQEDHGPKQAWPNSSRDPISKKPITKIGLVEWLKVKTLSSNLSTEKKKSMRLKNS